MSENLVELSNEFFELASKKKFDELEQLIKNFEKRLTIQEQLEIAAQVLKLDEELMVVHLWRLSLALTAGDRPLCDFYLENFKRFNSVGILRLLISYAERRGNVSTALSIAESLARATKDPKDYLSLGGIARRFGRRDVASNYLNLALSNSSATNGTKIAAACNLDFLQIGTQTQRLELKRKYLPFFNIPTPQSNRRIQVEKGIYFYGNDFYAHVTAGFLIGLITTLKEMGVPVTILSTSSNDDDVTAHYKNISEFVFVKRQEDLLGMSGRHELLIDVSGITSTSILNLKQKIAKTQFTYLGHGDISPIEGIDGIVLDEYSGRYTKQMFPIHEIPQLFAYWPLMRPQENAEHIEPEVVFGVYCDPAKLDEKFFSALSKILEITSDQVGFFHKDLSDDVFRDHLLDTCWRFRISPDQIKIFGKCPYRERLGQYRKSKVILDGIPFNNGTVACEALFMGSRLVTVSGESQFERQCGSILMAVDEEKNICNTVQEYIEQAIFLSKLPVLPINYFRHKPLFNFKDFTRRFLDSFY